MTTSRSDSSPPVQTQLTEEAKRLLELAEKATNGYAVTRYDHGGGRVAHDDGHARWLVADLYNEDDREFWIAAREIAPALADAYLAQQRELRSIQAVAVMAQNHHAKDTRLDSLREIENRARAAVSVGSPETRETE